MNYSTHLLRPILQKSRLSPLVLLLLIAFLGNPLHATTIIPFPNLGEMALASDAVVVAEVLENYELQLGETTKYRTGFVIAESIKGDFSKGEPLELQAWREKMGDLTNVIWGDPEFTEGKSYLLFLSRSEHAPYWQPMMLAYGIFEKANFNNDVYFIPSEASQEIEMMARPDGIVPEPMSVYHAPSLTAHLSSYISGSSSWHGKEAVAPEGEIMLLEKAAPAHCTFLTSTYPFRYTGFPADDIELSSENDGDTSMGTPANAHTQVTNAISAMESAYPGIDWTYTGTTDYNPNCVGGTAQGGNFCTVVGVREGLVIYNDPCNQITDLVGCSGTLAIGGLYSSGTHTFDGITWNTGYKSYIVVNNGTGGCLSLANYTIMLTHELSHCLGIGHIAGSGTANMNPSCCVNITSLDEDCLNYSYASALPVELVDFSVQKQPRSVSIAWSTASEKNNDYFQLERSVEGGPFEAIATIPGAGNSQERQEYHAVDHEPGTGVNYYRLKQIDFDGQFELSPVRSVQFEIDREEITVFPVPLSGTTLHADFASAGDWEVEIEFIDVKGRPLFRQSQFLKKGMNKLQFSLDQYAAGVYWLRFYYGSNTFVKRVIKM